jgi:dTMP kinase
MGILITFEGIEGCGKTTQLKLLGDYLFKRGYPVYETREPGGTFIGDQIRRILLNPENKGIGKITELFLYEACRAQLIVEIISKRYRNDKEVILCDRYTDSTIVYQGYGRGIDMGIIEELNRTASNGIKPAITFLLDLDVNTGLERAMVRQAHHEKVQHTQGETAEQENRFEGEALEFHQKVREGYLKIASREPERIKIIDAKKGIEEVHREIVKIVISHLSLVTSDH